MAQTRRHSSWWLWGGVAALLVIGLGIRVMVIHSSAGELDADEAVVGLMGRRIAFGGDRPIFYYGQVYLGTLEPFTVAILFWLFDSTTTLLKLVPAFYSLGFIALSAGLAWRLFGVGPALLSAAYLALPPAMFALWSTKARGGYAELLFLGQALLLVTIGLAERRGRAWEHALWGVIAGLALWTHPLAIVFVLPSGLYLVIKRGQHWSALEAALCGGGFVFGAGPLIAFNLSEGFATVAQLLEGSNLQQDRWASALCFGRLGLPVIVGAAAPVSTIDPSVSGCGPPAGLPIRIAVPVSVALGAVLAAHIGALRRFVLREPGCGSAPTLLSMVVACTLVALIASPQLSGTSAEPRYALPLYAGVPLVAGAVWRLPLVVRVAAAAAVLALNTSSVVGLIATSPPQTGLESTPENRAQLIDWLVARDRHQLHTDYWIAFPVMFESRERVLAEVVSSGPNRYLPYADNVAHTPNAVWAFVRGSDPDQSFQARLASVGGAAHAQDVSVYRVYFDVSPEHVVEPPL